MTGGMHGKRVLVTGSSRGIGRAIALRLGKAGWSVALHYAGSDAEAQKARHALGTSCSGVYQFDLNDPNRAPALFSLALKDGPIHALVNNAGVYLPLDFLGASDAVFEANWHRTFA